MRFALNGQYPIDTKEQLEKAAEFFDTNLSRFHPNERAKIASALDDQAAVLRVNLDKDWIINYNRMNKSASLSPVFKNSMTLRKQACIRHKVELPKIASIDKTPNPCEIIDEIIKTSGKYSTTDLLETVIEFDKRAGIEYLYDNEIFDPYLTVFGDINNPRYDSVKLAGDATQYDLVRASRDMDKIASIKDKFGESFTKSFQKNPITSLNKLASPEKTVLSIIMR